jgi:hypothetical protein
MPKPRSRIEYGPVTAKLCVLAIFAGLRQPPAVVCCLPHKSTLECRAVVGRAFPALAGMNRGRQVDRRDGETGIDGFNPSRVVTPGSLKDFVDLVVPILQERGVYKRDYAPGTLREKLFGQSQWRPATHPAAARRGPVPDAR